MEVTPRELDEALVPLERAKAHITLAKAVLLLAQLRLKLRGEVLDEQHPLKKEQVRVPEGGGWRVGVHTTRGAPYVQNALGVWRAARSAAAAAAEIRSGRAGRGKNTSRSKSRGWSLEQTAAWAVVATPGPSVLPAHVDVRMRAQFYTLAHTVLCVNTL